MIIVDVLVSTYPSNLNTTCMYDKTMPKTIIITTTLLIYNFSYAQVRGAEQIRLEIVFKFIIKITLKQVWRALFRGRL